ncbi:hypothetical protein BIY23_02790 [Wolbachia pipientis]|uniref:Uncharacterized protein n=1 Tax=Wolbachia pipientis TaxID=955 RepID=A0A1E7QJG9_WOLPI|nr:hypothetical protein [Wolbachia pipientis]OEY86610.1 hypothetical protein BIY23_02790 [Wolbachia pipientis]
MVDLLGNGFYEEDAEYYMSITRDGWFPAYQHDCYGHYDHGTMYNNGESQVMHFDNIKISGYDRSDPGSMKLTLDLDNFKLTRDKSFPEEHVNSHTYQVMCGAEFSKNYGIALKTGFASIPSVNYYPPEHNYNEYKLSVDAESISCDGTELKFDTVSKGKLWGENRDKFSIRKVDTTKYIKLDLR